eukprot:Em0192g8a
MQRSARDGTLLASCEPEVKELMHQIDLLISEKQQELEDKVQALKTQLQCRERDLSALRVSLEQRDAEMERLRRHHAGPAASSRDTELEGQVLKLKSQMSKLQERYEQLKSKRTSEKHTSSKQYAHAQRSNEDPKIHTLTADIRRMELELSDAQHTIQTLQGNSSKLLEQLKNKDEQFDMLRTELSRKEQSLQLLRDTLKAKEDLIMSLESHQQLLRSAEVSRLQNELAQMQDRAGTVERQLSDELGVVKHRLEASQKENSRLKAEYALKLSRLEEEKALLIKRWKDETEQLRVQCVRSEETRDAEIRTCRSQLHDKECSLQALEDRAQRLEKQVQEMARDLESTRLKQQSSNPLLDAVKSEDQLFKTAAPGNDPHQNYTSPLIARFRQETGDSTALNNPSRLH